MNPLSPDKILRNLDHGYSMTHEEQAEVAAYIRQLQQAVLSEREACAKECEGRGITYAPHCAAAIRARSGK